MCSVVRKRPDELRIRQLEYQLLEHVDPTSLEADVLSRFNCIGPSNALFD